MSELSREESDRRAAAGEPFALRYRVPRGLDRTLSLMMRSTAHKPKLADEVEDFALLRSDGMPTYHLASCVDDADLRISHIIRGQDHLTNTFKHLLLFEALGSLPAVRASAPAGSRPTRQALQAQARARGQRHHLSRRRLSAPGFHQTFSASWAGRPRTTARSCLSTNWPPPSRSTASTAPTP